MDFSAPGIYSIEENTTYNIDMNGDGVLEPMTIRNSSYLADFLWGYKTIQVICAGGMWIEYNGERIELDCEWMQYGAIMCRDDGSRALFISSNDYSYPSTAIYSVIDDKLSFVDSIDLEIVKLDYFSMELDGNIYYFLGNQYLNGEVGLNEDFTIIYPDDGWFDVEKRTSAPSIAYHDFEHGDSWDEMMEPPFVDLDGFIYILRIDLSIRQLLGSECVYDTLYAGTHIRPLKMNLDLTRAIIESEDGRQWLLVPDEDYPASNGDEFYHEDEIFDGCEHAGP